MDAQTILDKAKAIKVNHHSSKPIKLKKGECFYSFMIEEDNEWIEVGQRYCNLLQLYIGKDLGYPRGKQFDW